MNIFNVDYPFSPFDTYPLTLNRILLMAFRYSGLSFFFEIFLSLLVPYSFPVWIRSPSLNYPFAVFSFFSPSIHSSTRTDHGFAFLRSPLPSRSLSPLRLFGPPFAGSLQSIRCCWQVPLSWNIPSFGFSESIYHTTHSFSFFFFPPLPPFLPSFLSSQLIFFCQLLNVWVLSFARFFLFVSFESELTVLNPGQRQLSPITWSKSTIPLCPHIHQVIFHFSGGWLMALRID